MRKKQLISIGVIGAAGAIGQMHTACVASRIDGARLSAVYDPNLDQTAAIAMQYGVPVMPSADALIESPQVDAVIIASWDETHAALTRKCIAARKPVFCEKPLATKAEDCMTVVEDEEECGKKLVQLGFMRRFDPEYRKMKEILDSGELGAPLMAHCISRTPRISPAHTTPMHITNIVIHEIDLFRWLLGEELISGQVLFPRSTGFSAAGLQDPQLVILQSTSGVLIDVEVAANSHYGYEIQCELVCEKGTIRLPEPPAPIVRSRLQCAYAIPDDWSGRFAAAYQGEIQHWVNYIRGLTVQPGPDCWDGYAACAISDALILAQQTGRKESILY